MLSDHCVTITYCTTGHTIVQLQYIGIRLGYILESGSQAYACCVHAVYVVHVDMYSCI